LTEGKKEEVTGDLLNEVYSKIIKSLEDQRQRKEDNSIFDEEDPNE
jgi:hypothetical protein